MEKEKQSLAEQSSVSSGLRSKLIIGFGSGLAGLALGGILAHVTIVSSSTLSGRREARILGTYVGQLIAQPKYAEVYIGEGCSPERMTISSDQGIMMLGRNPNVTPQQSADNMTIYDFMAITGYEK